MFFSRRKSFTRMLNPKYGTICSAYGISYRRVADRAELGEAINEMLTTDGPFLLECVIREEDNVLPMTPPGMSVDEMLLDIDC